ncbi:MAG: C39 family peptidase [Hyphomonadaceae bacterium]|nr:C39 family peptidase [Hyphomonadaceae bacterium]
MMAGPTLTPQPSPLRLWRGGVVLACAALAWSAVQTPAAAQVRTHGEAGGSFTVSVMSWRDIPFRSVVRQQFDYSCGSAAVATLLRHHYGLSVNEAEVFQAMYATGDQARIQEVGFSMLDMRSYLQSRGFVADGLRLSLDRLSQLGIPVIALITHDNYRHFVVVKGIEGDRVLVGDPTFGLQTYTRAEFEAVWNGIVLAVRRAPEGVQTPVFNQQSDWSPWSVAPLDAAQGPISPSDLTRHFGEIYQISPVIVD